MFGEMTALFFLRASWIKGIYICTNCVIDDDAEHQLRFGRCWVDDDDHHQSVRFITTCELDNIFLINLKEEFYNSSFKLINISDPSIQFKYRISIFNFFLSFKINLNCPHLFTAAAFFHFFEPIAWTIKKRKKNVIFMLKKF